MVVVFLLPSSCHSGWSTVSGLLYISMLEVPLSFYETIEKTPEQ